MPGGTTARRWGQWACPFGATPSAMQCSKRTPTTLTASVYGEGKGWVRTWTWRLLMLLITPLEILPPAGQSSLLLALAVRGGFGTPTGPRILVGHVQRSTSREAGVRVRLSRCFASPKRRGAVRGRTWKNATSGGGQQETCLAGAVADLGEQGFAERRVGARRRRRLVSGRVTHVGADTRREQCYGVAVASGGGSSHTWMTRRRYCW